ncbi:hypothetical protein [Streptomyces diastaticus]|uniref:hypothetical protein n=1 Tax=Streptomyces diastaticus TaxID=1956 RepID=UPI003D168BA7
MSCTLHIHVDYLGVDLPLAGLSPLQAAVLDQAACACCHATAPDLRPAGHIYTTSPTAGRLGWAVSVCPACPDRSTAR